MSIKPDGLPNPVGMPNVNASTKKPSAAKPKLYAVKWIFREFVILDFVIERFCDRTAIEQKPS